MKALNAIRLLPQAHHLLLLFAGTVLWLSIASVAFATPIAELRYLETDLGGGNFRYAYILSNTSDPVQNAGFNAFNVFLTFNAAQTFILSETPSGWEAVAGFGFVEFFSVRPGQAPGGSDVAPGGSLSGFVLDFPFKAGTLPFEVLFTNPTDPENPALFSALTSPIVISVSEPNAVLLGALGILALPVFNRLMHLFFG